MPTSATGSRGEQGFTPLRRSAENGFTPPRRSAENGFTLVELMVVIAIMALATGVVALSLPPSNAHVRVQAEMLAARMLAARDIAILQSRDMAVTIDAQGSGVERRRRGAWQPVNERPFERSEWRTGTQALVAGQGQRVVFDSVGTTEAASVTLADGTARATVAVAADGTIRVER
jgi:general secretion pathway protein H